MERSMRVGVTGASGYVGRAALRRLATGGHMPVAFVRHEHAAQELGPGETITGDIRDPAALATLAATTDAVVHAAAYVHRAADTGPARAECFAVNEGGTRALVEAMSRTGARPALVFVSSIAVYGATFANASESTEPHPVTAYGASKLAAERLVLDAARGGEIRACVLRPAVVYGPGAPGNTRRLEAMIRRGIVPRVRGAANRKSMVHVDDLADAIVCALEAIDRVNGEVFNVAGAPVTVDEIVGAIARAQGVAPRWLPVPASLVSIGGATSRVASRLTGGGLPDLSGTLEAFAGEATIDASAIVRRLGARFRPTPESLTSGLEVEPGR